MSSANPLNCDMATAVKKAAFIKNLVNATGKTVRVSVVTETDSWKRPQVGADAVEARCTGYVEGKLDSLPAGTVEVQMQFVMKTHETMRLTPPLIHNIGRRFTKAI